MDNDLQCIVAYTDPVYLGLDFDGCSAAHSAWMLGDQNGNYHTSWATANGYDFDVVQIAIAANIKTAYIRAVGENISTCVLKLQITTCSQGRCRKAALLGLRS